MKRLISITTAIVIVMALAIPVFAQDPSPGTGSTNFTVMNLSDSTDATVQADYICGTATLCTVGDVSVSVPGTIGARGSQGFPASGSGLPDNWMGSVIISSDQPAVAFAQMIWTNAALATTEGRYQTAGAYNGFTAGANKLFLPSLSQRPGAQDTVIAVQSADAASTSETVGFSIKFYDRAGLLTHTINDTVNKGAQKSYTLSDLLPATPLFAATNGNGAAVIEATNPTDLLAASATMHWVNYSAAYSAVTGGGTKISLPSATRRIADATNWLQYTGVIVQNLDPALSADARVTWYDRNGNSLHVFTDTIPANSAHGYNTRFIETSDVPATSHATLPVNLTDNWNGSVVIESVGTGTADLVAVSNLQWFMYHPSSPNSASAYTSFASGTETVFVPATFRRGTGVTSAEITTQFTGLIVQNVGDTACNDFGVSWMARGETVAALTYTDSLDPNISHGYNTKQGPAGSDFPATADLETALGADFRGAVTISGAAGCELVAIHNTVWPIWTDSTTYNGFGQ